MSKQNTRTLSESDAKMLDDYLHLTSENREKVKTFLAMLAASQCTPAPSPDSQR